jgi:F-type H+-transporting ATPase subunit b
MNFSWWTFALQVANFLILVWLLRRFLFKPVKTIVARRKEEISRALTEVSAQRDGVDRLKREVEVERSQIDAERDKVIAEARAQVAAERQKSIEQARDEAQKLSDQALKRLAEERDEAAKELFERALTLAMSLAERLLREVAIRSIEQPFLGRVLDYLDQLPAEQRAKFFSNGREKSLLVTTAHALGTDEQSDWREQLAKRLGAELSIKFNTDPALIAGTVITFPQGILRFNWHDTLAAALKGLSTDEPPR